MLELQLLPGRQRISFWGAGFKQTVREKVHLELLFFRKRMSKGAKGPEMFNVYHDQMNNGEIQEMFSCPFNSGSPGRCPLNLRSSMVGKGFFM